jgi:hypothetical protein
MPDEEPTTFAKPGDIAAVWRPLTDAESTRAMGLLGFVEREILRRWPNVTARLADDADPLTEQDIADVEVWTVLPLLGVDPRMVAPNAKTFQRTAGTESVSITLAVPGTDSFLTFLGWMVDVFEPETEPADDWGLPSIEAPPSGFYEQLGLGWSEERRPGRAPH